VDVGTWTQFLAIKKELKDTSKFKTLIFDTIDMAFFRCVRHICNKLNIEERADAPWNKGWEGVKTEFTKQILDLSKLGIGMVFISHQSTEKYKDRRGREKEKIVPSLKDKGAFILNAIVDVWAPILDKEDGGRILQLRGGENVDAGHRLSREQFKNFATLEEIDLGKNEQEAYSALYSALYPKEKNNG